MIAIHSVRSTFFFFYLFVSVRNRARSTVFSFYSFRQLHKVSESYMKTDRSQGTFNMRHYYSPILLRVHENATFSFDIPDL